LSSVGNGQVPLCAAWAASALFETGRQVDAACGGPAEVDFLDLL
jgi:hypothetical protein